ncbi:MAG: type III pantothenate kinase [Coriobacteriia bacterium]|nr:type III pantothenate kinase [Coriobacteriia bacterium]MCL2749508.1 type III pantothenate kinase [Coriobacteriia bacterium]
MKDNLQAPYVLAVDVANQITRFGLFSGDALQASWSVTTPARITSDEARLTIKSFLQDSLETGEVTLDAILSCVVPDLSNTWFEALRTLCKQRPLVVSPGIKTGLHMNYNDPSEVGSDRIADMVAAKKLFGYPLIIIDCDTTINYQVLCQDGSYVGGLIAAGPALTAQALSQAAAKLPIIELSLPQTVLGKNTRESIQSGIIRGEVASINGLIEMIWAELGYETTVVLSGEHAPLFAPLLSHEAVIGNNLTLIGLSEIYKLNRK